MVADWNVQNDVGDIILIGETIHRHIVGIAEHDWLLYTTADWESA